jgi:uncharacterized LabA/DUF88 family protein
MNKKYKIKSENNYAFIDAQNLFLGVKSAGWEINYKSFRQYLKDKFSVEIAYLFIGYISAHSQMYAKLQRAGFILIFKETLVVKTKEGEKIKGNVDAELVLQAMIDIQEYNQAIIVTGDGDFACLMKYLKSVNKLSKVIVPHHRRYSKLIKKTAKEDIISMNDLKIKVELKK